MGPNSGSFLPNQGLSSLLKEGSKHITGLDEAVARNIDACRQLSAIVRTSLGPSGMNKMIVNHLGKLFVTSDAATIVRELEVIHPAAKLIVMASEAQEREVGDGTGFVVAFAGELLDQAEKLLRMGLPTADIVKGYERAAEEALAILEGLGVHKVPNIKDVDAVSTAMSPALASKHYGLESILARLVTKACVSVLPANINMFSVENVRVAKVLGGSVSDSAVVNGAVLLRDAEGTITKVKNARVAIYTCDFEASQSETKGTVLLKSAKEFTNYNKSEELMLESKIKSISEAGVTVIAAPKFGEVAMHFLEKYKIMVIRCQSKFDLRRIARTTGAIALAKMNVPTTDEQGRADHVEVQEIGSTKCIVFKQDKEGSRIATILVRASTQNLLDDIDRSIDDAVNVFKGITRDPRFVAGAGACEIELSRKLIEFAEARPGLDQYAIKKYAEALEVIPRVLAETSGFDATNIISSLVAAHAAGKATAGLDIEGGVVADSMNGQIFDLLITKHWAIKLATDAVCNILRVDQIIMAKRAGGPKPRDMQAADSMDQAP
ncbi:TCP-1/cpn60 chaperonin [Gracilaria domingensis]|nr:TCP-1/cpn60 chaperonin [Gracilaria domingensis]